MASLPTLQKYNFLTSARLSAFVILKINFLASAREEQKKKQKKKNQSPSDCELLGSKMKSNIWSFILFSARGLTMEWMCYRLKLEDWLWFLTPIIQWMSKNWSRSVIASTVTKHTHIIIKIIIKHILFSYFISICIILWRHTNKRLMLHVKCFFESYRITIIFFFT